MKPSNHADAQRIIGRIEAGTASRSDIVALLIYLREHLNDRDPVKDIAHCVAHSDRDRGVAFKYIEAFVDGLIDTIQHGGRISVTVLFPISDVIQHLIEDLQRQGLTVQPDAFRQQSDMLQTQVGDILDGVTVKLSNPHVIECRFATAGSNSPPMFTVRLQGLEHAKVLQVPSNVALAFPVLQD